MKCSRSVVMSGLIFGLLVVAGCGSPPVELPKEDEVANQKVETMKRLADAMAKEADGVDARFELENFPQHDDRRPEEFETSR